MKKINFDSNSLFKRILLVEDDSQMVAEMSDVLDAHFFEVTTVSSAPEAIQSLLKNEFDAIVCDFTIRNLPAEMFLQAINRIRPELIKRLVAISNTSDSNNIRNTGVVSIWKPVDPQILLEAIEGVLKRGDRESQSGRRLEAA